MLRSLSGVQMNIRIKANIAMLKAIDVHKSYKDLKVLKGIDLQVEQSEVVSIVGKSGAGKSTLLHILGTLDGTDLGQVIIDDKDLSKLSSKELAAFRNASLGFIFQFHNLLPEFSALENVCLPAYIGGKDEKSTQAKATALLTRLGLADRLENKPSELSGGEQQRVAVARALINDPKIVFADEPSGNLDSQTAKELHHLFFDLRDEFGFTFIIVTHNEELAKMADRIIELRDGKVVNTLAAY